MTDEPPYLVRIGTLQEDAAKLLYYSLPEGGWKTCTFTYRKVGPVGESLFLCTFMDGREESHKVPMAVIRAFKALRHEMASLGKGAWLSTVMTIDHSGNMKVTYNYDERPSWFAAVADEAYIEDLKKYPRHPAAIPDWYPRA